MGVTVPGPPGAHTKEDEGGSIAITTAQASPAGYPVPCMSAIFSTEFSIPHFNSVKSFS